MDVLADLFGRFGIQRSYPKDVYIYRQGDTIRNAHLLCAGTVRMIHAGPDGTQFCRVVSGPYKPLDFASSLQKGQHFYNACALTRAEVSVVPAEELLKAACDTCALPSVCRALAAEACDLQIELLRHCCLPAKTRLIHLLCQFVRAGKTLSRASDSAAESFITLPISKKDIAAWIGITPVHLSRLLATIEREGVLRRNGRAILMMGDANPRGEQKVVAVSTEKAPLIGE